MQGSRAQKHASVGASQGWSILCSTLVHASPGYGGLCLGTLLATQLGTVHGLGRYVLRRTAVTASPNREMMIVAMPDAPSLPPASFDELRRLRPEPEEGFVRRVERGHPSDERLTDPR